MEVVGLVSSCIAIGELAVKSLRLLHSLQQKVNNSGLHLQTVRTQISAVNAAVTHIQSWLNTCTGNPCMVEGLIEDLQLSLDGCKSLLEIFSEQATQVMKEHNTQGWIDKIKLVWTETDLSQYRDMLRDQVQALSLLLQVVQLPTQSEQTSALAVPETQKIIGRARDDSTSIVLLRDTDTCRTIGNQQDNDDGDRMSISFDFDSEVFQSRAYKMTLASYIRHKMLEDRAAAKDRAADNISVMHEDPILELVYHYRYDDVDNTYEDIQSLSSIAYSLGVEQTKLEWLLLEAKKDRQRKFHQNLTRLGPAQPGMLKSLLSTARTTAGLVELNCTYRLPYGLSPITLDDLNSFRRAWRMYDSYATGYISELDFPLLLRVSVPYIQADRDADLLIAQELEDPFSVRLYAPEFSIHGLLSGIDTTLAPPGSGPFLQILGDKLEKLPVNEIKRRRVALDLLSNEVSVMTDPLRGTTFLTALTSILNYKRSTDADWRSSSGQDIVLAVKQSSSTMLGAALRRHIKLIQAEEKRRTRFAVGLFDTLYWSRLFRECLERRRASQISEPSSAPSPDTVDQM
ncbi:hypothetical protein BDV38DRAFT_284576 [Aspergillus pseudotamarii]|uniref:Fungal N-terminal domain-containing protein n=1 Tax=Aspergillus pseudotamarii TaxID=132259 RepID=A0A5N6SQP4_ASPPS|nr:uncharacterized protein BDV38DRAFT_284576 [Aspergillus pseudotamarii]KAE8135693.1 hypothetical protein BDV38DRAFT_284576 [Aspergillus pseudotamarii]